jgi:hypothetical protein
VVLAGRPGLGAPPRAGAAPAAESVVP